jgi:hypothetical protein
VASTWPRYFEIDLAEIGRPDGRQIASQIAKSIMSCSASSLAASGDSRVSDVNGSAKTPYAEPRSTAPQRRAPQTNGGADEPTAPPHFASAAGLTADESFFSRSSLPLAVLHVAARCPSDWQIQHLLLGSTAPPTTPW